MGQKSDSIKKKKELLRKAVPMLPDAPDNAHISKAEFIRRRREKTEEDLAVEAYREKYRSEKSAPKKEEKKDEVQEEEKEVKKVGRPKKIED